MVVVDEIAALTAPYVTDRKARVRSSSCWGCCSPKAARSAFRWWVRFRARSKDALPLRQLFTVRIGLRLTEATQTTMVLGQAARDAGADCDRISSRSTTPGVGYVMMTAPHNRLGCALFYVTDHDITRTLAARFRPPRAATSASATAGAATPIRRQP